MNKATIISGFPAIGKTHLWKNDYEFGGLIYDSDSSNFSWVKDKSGNNTKKRNPDFPQNYIDHIKKNLNKADIILVSSHGIVRKALERNNLDYILIYPSIELKDEWTRRFEKRGDNEAFIVFISSHWDDFINDIESETFPRKIKLKSEEYLLDIIQRRDLW